MDSVQLPEALGLARRYLVQYKLQYCRPGDGQLPMSRGDSSRIKWGYNILCARLSACNLAFWTTQSQQSFHEPAIVGDHRSNLRSHLHTPYSLRMWLWPLWAE